MSSILGIDEAGRGPLAGPVAVGAVSISKGFDKHFFNGIKDSKKLSLKDRELWFSLAMEAKKKGDLDFHVALISEKVIDRHGISYAIKLGIKRCLESLDADHGDRIFLDGSLKAPESFENQLTVIKGDEKIPVISLASICAKVVRDRRMVNMAKKFPGFGFEVHKGYGTRAHLLVVKSLGPSPLHRRSFLKKLTLPK